MQLGNSYFKFMSLIKEFKLKTTKIKIYYLLVFDLKDNFDLIFFALQLII